MYALNLQTKQFLFVFNTTRTQIGINIIMGRNPPIQNQLLRDFQAIQDTELWYATSENIEIGFTEINFKT